MLFPGMAIGKELLLSRNFLKDVLREVWKSSRHTRVGTGNISFERPAIIFGSKDVRLGRLKAI
ncbi:hypothetical protein CY34DRAFT_691338 [Suillus luteus UH-Slu-Lm8-n1]|uniref:Uncharacterized protein n=1 Tax=Suillus luteus UH-Slu-Lm8-n1 TaxID=930992 RepID=A0A0D0ANT8_9AGAM|nr:hypothetical protein CY34DRAFT_691338 [Suillus luteus UH-Slu-Lm8-n1]